MAKLNSEALIWLLNNTSSPAIYDVVRKIELLWPILTHGGFQLNRNSFEKNNLRLRLASVLQRNEDFLCEFLKNLGELRHWQTVRQAVKIVHPEWLKKNWRNFLRTVGDPRPWVMGLYWEGETNARLCQLLFGCPSLWQEPSGVRQDSELAACLRLITTADSSALAKTEISKQTGLLKNCQQETTALRKQLEQLRKEHKHLQQEKENEQTQWRRQCSTLQRELQTREQEWQQQIRKMNAEALEQTRREIASYQQKTLGLHPDQEVQIETARKENASLQERLEKALQRQAESNRRYGLRQQLRKEISELEESLRKIQQAIDEAVVVFGDLPALQKEVEQKLRELYAILREENDELSLAVIPSRLKTLIKTIKLDETAPRKFTEILQFLEHDCIHGLLLPDELVSLKKLLEDRRKLHNSQVSSVEARKSLHYHTREIWALTPFINDFKRISLYIDGCNLLLSDSQWNAMTKKQGQTAAREDLLAKCKSKAKLFKAIQLIFDGVGSQNTSEKIEAGLTLHFAAQLQTDQNADNYLVRMLKDTPKTDGELRWVVTDDMGLRYRVEALCEAIVPISSFAQFLRIS